MKNMIGSLILAASLNAGEWSNGFVEISTKRCIEFMGVALKAKNVDADSKALCECLILENQKFVTEAEYGRYVEIQDRKNSKKTLSENDALFFYGILNKVYCPLFIMNDKHLAAKEAACL